MNITDYHRAIFEFLEQYRKDHPEANLTYSLRNNNSAKRPKHLYLFTGNDFYIFVGMYAPHNGNNKTRSVGFEVGYDTAQQKVTYCALEIVFNDPKLDHQYPVYKQVIDQIGWDQFKTIGTQKFQYFYKSTDWKAALLTYLTEHKPIIDQAIKDHGMNHEFFIPVEKLETAIEELEQTIDQLFEPDEKSDRGDYSWIPFYSELCTKLNGLTSSQLTDLTQKVLMVQKLRGLVDQDAHQNEFPLTKMDPYTFLSFTGIGRKEKQLAVLARLKEWLSISTALPTGLSGLYFQQNQRVWLFGYSYERQSEDIDKLRNLYQQVETNTVTEDVFNSVLTIKRTSMGKVSESLFKHRPELYFPINGKTRSWLQKRKLPNQFTTWNEYRQLLEAIREFDKRPFYKIVDEAYWEGPATVNLPSEEQTNYWIFQGNPAQFRIVDSLKDNALRTWRVAAHAQTIKPGDKIILWVVGKQSGCYALAQVASEIYTGTDESGEQYYQTAQVLTEPTQRVKINIEHNLWDKPILKPQLQDLPAFTGFNGGNQGTNFTATRYQYELILKMAQAQPESTHPKNIILYGPPGTGKTYTTIELAVEIIDGALSGNHQQYKQRFDVLRKDGQIEFVTFHQNYTYEDFVVGIRPELNSSTNGLSFKDHQGVFLKIAKRATSNFLGSFQQASVVELIPFEELFSDFITPVTSGKELPIYVDEEIAFYLIDYQQKYKALYFRESAKKEHQSPKKDARYLSVQTLKELYLEEKEVDKEGPYYEALVNTLHRIGRRKVERPPAPLKNFVLIIDEINRANISRVFGELITLLEEDKRLGEPNELTVTLPNGEPFSVPPNLYLIGTMNTADKSLALLDIALRRRFEFVGKYPNSELLHATPQAKALMERLNKVILNHKKSADFLIGHAYFIGKTDAQLKSVMDNRVIPLLMEYFNGRTDLVLQVLKEAGTNCTINELTYQIEYTNETANQPG
ncbi:McrB family protein [Rudanella lutea]|uniref:McrB family protein n=1 Tax=Rudanella lutea TaxID=451374 RepID=UPI00036DB304|nr:AAA family ATPase [Rudanella lutea]